jgi:hypothetical protein
MVEQPDKKNPLLAGLMSAVIVGTGHLYLRLPVKAIGYMAFMATLIVAQVHADRAEHHVVIAIMMSAFYAFQIYDAFQDARGGRRDWSDTGVSGRPSLWGALLLIAVGTLLLLSNLGLIHVDLADILDFWPVALIVLGLKMAIHSNRKEKEQ